LTTVQEHQEIRRKYTQLAWQLWRSQYQAGFIVKHPIPEEHLRIEIRAFLEGRISEIHGFADPLGQAKDAIIAAIKPAVQWVWDFVIKPAVEWGLEATGWLGSKIPFNSLCEIPFCEGSGRIKRDKWRIFVEAMVKDCPQSKSD